MRKQFLAGWVGLTLLCLVSGYPAAGQKASRPNIILLSVDTLRADHLGIYGYSRKTSPNLDRFLAGGTVFTDASCNVPLTNPSFVSMLSSRYPHQTGATRNGVPMLPATETATEIFKRNGYTTAAILSNWPLKEHLSGLQKGFGLYDDDFIKKRWLVFNSERDAAGVTENAAAWLEAKPQEPFFAWVHYSDPHAPYLLHEDFSFRSADRVSPAERSLDDYDSEIAYTDHHIGELLQALRKQPYFSRTVVVFVADHGENLGEHDYSGHGRVVYQPSMHVPFAWVGPGIPTGKRLDRPVELLDLAPTLLGLAGLPAGKAMLGQNLLPVIQQTGAVAERSYFFETYPGAMPGAGELAEGQKPIWIGFREGSRKISYSVRFSKWEYYDLSRDPGELKNLAKMTDPEFVARSDRLMDWYTKEQAAGWAMGETDAVTDEDRQQLESLGYVDK